MKKVVLAPNPYRDKSFKSAFTAEKLLNNLGVKTKMCLPFEVDNEKDLNLKTELFNLQQELTGADLLICFGGDGTILHSSKQAAYNNIPILGVNVGTMGFMAELEPNELHLLESVVNGQYKLDTRMMLDVSVVRSGKAVYKDLALNDAVVSKGAMARTIPIVLDCDGLEVSCYTGDGAIVCTPTGSTAYSMSAGGPIVEPTANNIIITPICAHTMHTKAFVLSDEREVAIKTGKSGKKAAYLSVDGGRAFRINPNDRVVCKKSGYDTKLVRIKNLSFYSLINNKFKNY